MPVASCAATLALQPIFLVAMKTRVPEDALFTILLALQMDTRRSSVHNEAEVLREVWCLIL